MKMATGVYNVQRKEDWVYIINLLGFDPRKAYYWDECKTDFCVNIHYKGDDKYSFSYADKRGYLDHGYDGKIKPYVRNDYTVDLI